MLGINCERYGGWAEGRGARLGQPRASTEDWHSERIGTLSQEFCILSALSRPPTNGLFSNFYRLHPMTPPSGFIITNKPPGAASFPPGTGLGGQNGCRQVLSIRNPIPECVPLPTEFGDCFCRHANPVSCSVCFMLRVEGSKATKCS